MEYTHGFAFQTATGEHRWQKQSGDIEVLGARRSPLTISEWGQVLDTDRNEIGKARKEVTPAPSATNDQEQTTIFWH